MLEFIHLRDSSRLKNKLESQKNNRLSVAFLGGSITSGLPHFADSRFSHAVLHWLNEYLPDCNIEEHNLGTVGLSSLNGIYQSIYELPPCQPDIIFLEFAINDRKDAEHQSAFESMVFHCLSLPNKPAVILLLTKSKVNYSCKNFMNLVGEHYHIPSVCIADALDNAISSGDMTWDDYSGDYAHPHAGGHSFIASLITLLFENALLYQDKELPIPKDSFFNHDLSELHFINPLWINSPESVQPPFTMTTYGNYLYVQYMVSPSSSFGNAILYVDGVETEALIAYRIDSWDHPFSKIIFLGEKKQKHEISISMQKGEEKREFALRVFGFC